MKKKKRMYLTWEQVEQLLVALVLHLQTHGVDKKCCGVYGPPRGGLIPAVVLSHKLDLPLLLKPKKGMLWVDDIVDSGETMDRTRRLAGAHASLCMNQTFYRNVELFCPMQVSSKTWIVFPWENQRAAMRRDVDFDKLHEERCHD